MFGSFFVQDHLLNSFILGVYAQRWPKVHVFQNRNWGPFHRKEFEWKKLYGGTGLVSEKTKALNVEPNEIMEAATKNFYNIFILCLWIRIIRRSDQGVKFKNFFFADIFFNSVLYGCGFLLLLWKSAQNDRHCNCIVPP